MKTLPSASLCALFCGPLIAVVVEAVDYTTYFRTSVSGDNFFKLPFEGRCQGPSGNYFDYGQVEENGVGTLDNCVAKCALHDATYLVGLSISTDKCTCLYEDGQVPTSWTTKDETGTSSSYVQDVDGTAGESCYAYVMPTWAIDKIACSVDVESMEVDEVSQTCTFQVFAPQDSTIETVLVSTISDESCGTAVPDTAEVSLSSTPTGKGDYTVNTICNPENIGFDVPYQFCIRSYLKNPSGEVMYFQDTMLRITFLLDGSFSFYPIETTTEKVLTTIPFDPEEDEIQIMQLVFQRGEDSR